MARKTEEFMPSAVRDVVRRVWLGGLSAFWVSEMDQCRCQNAPLLLAVSDGFAWRLDFGRLCGLSFPLPAAFVALAQVDTTRWPMTRSR